MPDEEDTFEQPQEVEPPDDEQEPQEVEPPDEEQQPQEVELPDEEQEPQEVEPPDEGQQPQEVEPPDEGQQPQEVELFGETDVSEQPQHVIPPDEGDAFEQPLWGEERRALASSDDAEEEPYTTSSQSSQQSVPEEEISIWSDEIEEQQKKRQLLNNAVSGLSGGRVSPILSTLNTSWDDISTTQQKYYLRKAKETFNAVLTVLSPGQEEELWTAVRQKRSVKTSSAGAPRRRSFDPSSGLIDVLIKSYNQAESWQTKRQILSLFANDFSKQELMAMIPTLTKWRIDEARQHATKVGKGQPVQNDPIFRSRISSAQIDHFVDYLARPDMVQDVAFGTKVLRLDTGESIIIPAVVRTMIPSRIIEQYSAYCKEQNFEPAGQRSLYRIIEVCGASMQKSLQGLDNTTAEGTEAIDTILDVIKTLGDHGSEAPWLKSSEQKIKEAKRYLKTEFKSHGGREESCADHCTTHALSDPSNANLKGTCQHEHSIVCETCESLETVFKEIESEINHAEMSEEQRWQLSYEFKLSVASIKDWKAHLLRTVNQDEGKQYALAQLDSVSCLVVMDWAMKYLPQRYRERMSDFFGKRGRSWHVSAVITKEAPEKFQVECFVHLLDNCTQDSFAVASIIEHLLETIKKESPDITNVYLRSDNAGCYHSGPLLLSLPSIAQRTCIKVLRYDFSEPQSGKDICDRKTAPMKAHIRRWVNEKHDVITAEDMKTALESHGGLKGVRAAVVKVDTSREISANKIPGISILNNFSFEEDGVRVWRAFSIGPGNLLSYKELEVAQHAETGVTVLQQFGPRSNTLGTVSQESTPRGEIFSCNESTCVLTFKTREEAEAHMDAGKHVRESDGESVYDMARKKWANIVTEMHVSSGEAQRIAFGESGPSSTTECRSEGWALKTIKRSPRIGEKVKAFLIQKFNQGAAGGQKADPVQVAREMKCARDGSGKLQFKPEEWRTAKQISSFFSRMSAIQRQRQAGEIESQEDEEIAEEDLEALESEDCIQAIRQKVYRDIEAPNHPIQVKEVNVCELARAGKLDTLKLAQLRDVCTALQLQSNGSYSRKRTYTEPLMAYSKSCSCQK